MQTTCKMQKIKHVFSMVFVRFVNEKENNSYMENFSNKKKENFLKKSEKK